MHISGRLAPYFEALLRLVYPSHCGVCHSLLELEEKGICLGCRGGLAGLRLDFQESCLETSLAPLGESWALYPYESPVKELLAAVKFSGKRWLLKIFEPDLNTFGILLAAENHYDALVPIPLDPKRLLVRHFNQAGILAAHLSRAMHVPVKNILKKRYSTPAQSRLGQSERRVNLYHAFQVSDVPSVEGKSVLLVDDVLTTGSTAQEAGRRLRESGAKRVDFLALACTPRTLALS